MKPEKEKRLKGYDYWTPRVFYLPEFDEIVEWIPEGRVSIARDGFNPALLYNPHVKKVFLGKLYDE